jgi:peptide chain release factor 3
MEMEKERGISISSTVMNFDYNTLRINILDTPGHEDFSEDTYRALAAADNALMLLDGAKGLEPQTRKLFEVCRMRNLPIFTFVNKLDRPALSPYEIIDQIQDEFGLETHPILWPIGDGDRFKGVLDRMKSHL